MARRLRKSNRRRFRSGRNSRYRRGHSKKKVLRLSVRDAKSKKVNNNSEKVLRILTKRIAQETIDKNRVVLVHRKQLYANYDPLTNEFGIGRLISFKGDVVRIGEILKQDLEFQANNPLIDDPDTMEDEAAIKAAGGVGLGAILVPMHGKRKGNTIVCRSISIGIRARVQAVEPQDVPGTYDGCWLYWAVVAVRSAATAVPLTEPEPRELLTVPLFNYDSKLDTDIFNRTAEMMSQTVMKGKLYLRFRKDRCDVKFQQRHKKYTAKITFDPADQDGQSIIKGRQLLLVFRSNIPEGAAFEQFQPEVCAYSKIRYVD